MVNLVVNAINRQVTEENIKSVTLQLHYFTAEGLFQRGGSVRNNSGAQESRQADLAFKIKARIDHFERGRKKIHL